MCTGVTLELSIICLIPIRAVNFRQTVFTSIGRTSMLERQAPLRRMKDHHFQAKWLGRSSVHRSGPIAEIAMQPCHGCGETNYSVDISCVSRASLALMPVAVERTSSGSIVG
jgi:hypothetical protein